jgi:hypothetical protein
LQAEAILVHSPKHSVVASLLIALLAAGTASPDELGFWRIKPIDAWTEDEAFQILSSSPWVKSLRPGLLHQQSEFERRDGGNMGGPAGLGFDGIGDEESVFASRRVGPVPTLLLRWETALPVRAARLKTHSIELPAGGVDAYVLAVYGVPGGQITGDPIKLGKPLRGQAVLRRAGKKDIRPLRAKVFQGPDGPIIVYEFPRTMEIAKSEKNLSFAAVIGRLSIVQVFDTEAMRFEGNLEF